MSRDTFLSLSPATLPHLLDLYPSLIVTHYARRVSTADGRDGALKRDKWRYNELPSTINLVNNPPKDMKFDGLKELVQWKITHGQYRQFLPAMTRKNTHDAVEKATLVAAEVLSSLVSKGEATNDDLWKVVINAMDEVQKIHGVGPATGTLILSCYLPQLVPFFSDELFQYLCADEWKQKGRKLKYNRTEYQTLFQAVRVLRERWEEEGGSGELDVVELEKGAFVLGHMDLLENGKKEALLRSLGWVGVGSILLADKDSNGPDPPEQASGSVGIEKVAKTVSKRKQNETTKAGLTESTSKRRSKRQKT